MLYSAALDLLCITSHLNLFFSLLIESEREREVEELAVQISGMSGVLIVVV